MHRNNFKKFAKNPEGMSGCPVEDEQRALEYVSFVKVSCCIPCHSTIARPTKTLKIKEPQIIQVRATAIILKGILRPVTTDNH